MFFLIILSMVLVVLFLGATIHHCREIPDSVSAMVYALPHAWRYLWTVWLWAVSMLLLPSLMDRLGSYWQFIGFLWCASMAFCGALPLIKGEDNQLHYVFGIAAGVLSQACVLVLCPWWLAAWVVYLVFLHKGAFVDLTGMWYGKNVFVAETICYVSLVGALACP